jgi:TPR repeat protein
MKGAIAKSLSWAVFESLQGVHLTARQGYGPAEYDLGMLYYKGHGVPQNPMKALYWLKKAKAAGGFMGGLAASHISMIEHE